MQTSPCIINIQHIPEPQQAFCLFDTQHSSPEERYTCIGFAWQGWGVRGATAVVSMRSC